MEIPIKHGSLVDSPYSDSVANVFTFPNSELEELVQDLKNGNPTCYLVSGYRGSGKSSYIKKLQSQLDNTDSSKEGDTFIRHLFVELNFAKYEEQSIVLRKLIRAYYQAFSNHDLFEVTQKKKPKETAEFKELYERTFYEVSKNTNVKNYESTNSTINFESSLKHLALLIAAILSAIGVNELITEWYNWIISSTFFAIVYAAITFKHVVSKGTDVSNETNHSELYDDEIAEYHLLRMIDRFYKEFRLVFVLDELDKIKESEHAEKLINEIKSIMLCGKANFIVVAGQGMFYQYHASKTEDDGFLSSLFSKTHHIPLFSAPQLRALFESLVEIEDLKLSDDEMQVLNSYKEYLIFQSMRVPRRFILSIRHDLKWNNNKAFLKIDKTAEDLDVYVKVNKRLAEVENEIDSEEFDTPISDYLKMQLMLQAHSILSSSGKSFSLNQLVNSSSNG
jgi:Cdc6-like AAA superfamily ATPase